MQAKEAYVDRLAADGVTHGKTCQKQNSEDTDKRVRQPKHVKAADHAR